MNSNIKNIRSSFETQAPNFEDYSLQFSSKEYLEYTLSNIDFNGDETVLDLASGTCICGRFFSKYIKSVVCLDATPAMLQIGKEKAVDENIDNIIFVNGYAENLPFLDETFDMVFTRLSFHHFVDIDTVFSEMNRVLKPNGKIVVIDMEATSENLRDIEDKIETMRDPSHIKNLSLSEIKNLFTSNKISISKCDIKNIRQSLKNWMNLTKTPDNVQVEITELMKKDLEGVEKTGFYPYIENGEIFFNQRWMFIAGIK